MTEAYAIKPCPFCGAGAKLEEQDSDAGGGQYITCINPLCEASSALIYPLMDRVDHLLLERWNRRAPVTVSEKGEAEALLKEAREDLFRLGGDSAMAYEHGDSVSRKEANDEASAIHARIDAYLSRKEQ